LIKKQALVSADCAEKAEARSRGDLDADYCARRIHAEGSTARTPFCCQKGMVLNFCHRTFGDGHCLFFKFDGKYRSGSPDKYLHMASASRRRHGVSRFLSELSNEA
jgi:hypothetical protein